MDITSNKFKAQRAGWLLACDSPKNIKKGELMFEELPEKFQRQALAKYEHCMEVYSQGD